MHIYVTGAGGQLGSNIFYRLHCLDDLHASLLKRELRGVHAVLSGAAPSHNSAPTPPPLNTCVSGMMSKDLTDEADIAKIFEAPHKPDVVIHCAAVTAVADALKFPEKTQNLNVDATATLAKYCAANGALFVHISTDMVFSGQPPADRTPPLFRESDTPGPLSAYGRSKLASEEAALSVPGGRTVVVRVPLMYGCPLSPSKLKNSPGTFLMQMKSLIRGEQLKGFCDETRTAISFWNASGAVCKLVAALTGSDEGKKLALAAAGEGSTTSCSSSRIFHIAGATRMTRLEMLSIMQKVAADSYKDPALRQLCGIAAPDGAGSAEEYTGKAVESCSRNDFPAAEPRPADLSLDTSKCRAVLKAHCGNAEELEVTDFALQVKAELARWVQFGLKK